MADLAALLSREKELAAAALQLEREREAVQREILALERRLPADSRPSPPEAKRLRTLPPPAPKEWRHLSQVQAEVAARRAAGELVPFGDPARRPRVYVDGCFDMMHSGHFNAVRQAKLLADEVGGTLVVGVHSDAEILTNKGPPVMNDTERLAVVAAVKWVDELLFDTPYSATLPFLDSIDADFCVHGDDISINADGTDAYAEAKAAGRIKIVKRTEGVSTTDIVGRLLLLTRSPHPLAAASDAAAYVGANISSSGVSQFLPTTWRLRQFSSGRTPTAAERVVYIDGEFDILHIGHVQALFEARRRGDFLFVGVHDDKTASKRGPHHPIMSLHERALSLLSLSCVDDVILGAPPQISADLLRTMNISTVVRSPDDPAGEPVPERYGKAVELGLLHELHDTHPISLDTIVRRIIDNRSRFEARNAKREKKELNYMQNEKKYLPEL